MAAKLADVAKHAGVSTATASRVLNNRMVMPISAATMDRVKRAARDLDYRPNPMARALLTGRTHALGLFSREMGDPHFMQLLEAAESEALQLGYHLVVSSSQGAVGGPGRVDGLLVFGAPEQQGRARRSDGFPVITVNSTLDPEPDTIGWSDAEGMYSAVRHLAELGHRRIAGLFCYGEEPHADSPKLVGFRRAVEQYGVEWRPYWRGRDPFEVHQTNQFDNGYLAAQDLLSDWQGFTGIVARNDYIALGALRALREAGKSVPGEVSVVGYNDSMLATCADPPLTSIRTPIAVAGAMAVQLLVQALNGGSVEHGCTMLPVSLTVRGSTARPGSSEGQAR